MKVEWYLSNYECAECEENWEDEWSCMCNDRCPICGQETCPTGSVDLSRALEPKDFLAAALRITKKTSVRLVLSEALVKMQPGGALVAQGFWISNSEAAAYATEILERG